MPASGLIVLAISWKNEKVVRCVLAENEIFWYGIDLICGVGGFANTTYAVSTRLFHHEIFKLKDLSSDSSYPQTILVTTKQARDLRNINIQSFLDDVQKEGVTLAWPEKFNRVCHIKPQYRYGMVFLEATLGGGSDNLESFRRIANNLPQTDITKAPDVDSTETNVSSSSNNDNVEMLEATNNNNATQTSAVPPTVNTNVGIVLGGLQTSIFLPISPMNVSPSAYYCYGENGHRYLVTPQRAFPTSWASQLYPYVVTYNGFYYVYSAVES